jgi:hypothetical protein
MSNGGRGLVSLELAFVSLATLTTPARGQVFERTLDAVVASGAEAGGVDVGGWRFSEFGFRSEGDYDLDPADVRLRITTDGSVERRFTVQFSLTPDAAAGDAGKLFIDYRVDFAPSESMNRVGLRFNGAVPSQGIGTGAASVLEAVSSLDGSDVAPGLPVGDTEQLSIYNDGPGRLDDSNSDFMSLNAKPGLRLAKEITLSAREAGQQTVSIVDNFLTVPEPTFLAAAPAALALLARRRSLSARRVN